jgi:hypothetical protein
MVDGKLIPSCSDRVPAAIWVGSGVVDTEAAVKLERERVARRCAEIADIAATLRATPEWIAQRIREEFGP